MDKLPLYKMFIADDFEGEEEVDFVALVESPAIQRNFLAFAEGVAHYTADGKLYEGPTHKDASGRLMTGAVHTADSEYLYHFEELAEVGPRGGIKESPKAPKSDTKNPNPTGEGTAGGDASGKRGAKVTAEQEKTLQNKVDDFNEKESNTKNGRATLGALKSVFQRGLGAYNTSHSPEVRSAEQWAFARVNAFLYLLKNGRPENPKYDTDFDLLPKGHPKEKMAEVIAFESYSDYPDGVKSNAKNVLEYTEANGWGSCGTPVGKQRANQLANGEPISLDTIQRMYSYLSRHEVDLESSTAYGDGCGKLMYDAWGGKAALGWSRNKLRELGQLEEDFSTKLTFAVQDEDQRIVSGPLMIADLPIYRKDEEGEYYVMFTGEQIKKIVQRFFKKGYQAKVNIEHGKKAEGVYMFESYIIDRERGVNPPTGFEDVVDGSWFGSFKVENEKLWGEVKAGTFKGFSVEGLFRYEKAGMIVQKEEQIMSQIFKILGQVEQN
jgi:hypothetical protein